MVQLMIKKEMPDALTVNQCWDCYLSEKSNENYQNLVEVYLPLVVQQVERLSLRIRSKSEKNELIGVGVMGLHNAVRLYNKEKCDNFAPYAKNKIHCAILDELRKFDHLTRNQRKNYRTICKAIKKLTGNLKRYPEYSEITEETNLSEAEIIRFMGMASAGISLDSETEDGLQYKNVIVDEYCADPAEEANKSLAFEEMKEAFTLLKKRERQLIFLRHFQNMKIKEISEVMDISEGRVSQLYKEIIVKLRSLMKVNNQIDF